MGTTERDVDVLEAMGTARAMRWLRPDPVSDDLVGTLIWAATRASSAHNSQPWEFVVVRDASLRAAIGEVIVEAVRQKDPMPPAETASDRRIESGVRNLFDHLHEVPVLVFVCGRNTYPHAAPDEKFMWSAMSGATQNMLVAARSLGLGMSPTMLHSLAEDRLRQLIGIPDDVAIGHMAVVGWPERDFGPLRRRPAEECVHQDTW